MSDRLKNRAGVAFVIALAFVMLFNRKLRDRVASCVLVELAGNSPLGKMHYAPVMHRERTFFKQRKALGKSDR